jgi:hypothetical protein
MTSCGSFLKYLNRPLVISPYILERLAPYPDAPKPWSLKQRENRLLGLFVVRKIHKLSNAYFFERPITIVQAKQLHGVLYYRSSP